MLPSPATESNPTANPVVDITQVSMKKGKYSVKFKSQVVAASNQAEDSTLEVSDGKERKSSRYIPELKTEVLKFAVSNSNIATSKQFNIPSSTVGEWIRKAVKAGDYVRDYDKPLVRSEVEDCITRSTEPIMGGNIAKKSPLVTNQEGNSLMIDIPSVDGRLDVSEKDYGSVIKETNQDLENDNASEEKVVESTPSSKMNRYSNSFRKKVVKFGEGQGWKAAAEKFGVSTNIVGIWARRMGKRLSKNVDDETKNEVVQFGLQHNSWIGAAKKFGVSHSTVCRWGKKAGYKLQTGSKVDDETKIEIVKFGLLHKSWIGAAKKFGVSPSTVGRWGKKAGFKLQTGSKKSISKVSKYSDSFREMVVKCGEENGWKAAGEKYGVSISSVVLWAKRLGRRIFKKVDDGTKDEIVKYGLNHNSWIVAAKKFGVSPYTVAYWGKKAGYKLQAGGHKNVDDETKNEIVKYGLRKNSWRAAAEHYGKSAYTVAYWGRKAGYKLKARHHHSRKDMTEITDQEAVHNNRSGDNSFEQYEGNSIQVERSLGGENNNHDTFSQEMIREAVVFADTNGLKAAARKFGVANHVVFKWSKKFKGGSAESEESSATTDQIGLSADNDSKKQTAKKLRKVQWVSKSDADTVAGVNFDHSQVTDNSASSGLDESGKIADSAVHYISYSENSVVPLFSQSSTTAACCPKDPEPEDNCEACGTVLAADETITEHVVSVHLTIEGLCDICGEDSEEFVAHFKIHLKSCQFQDVTPLLDIVKTESIDKADVNQNIYDYMDEDTIVKEETREEDGRWIINPFYKSC